MVLGFVKFSDVS